MNLSPEAANLLNKQIHTEFTAGHIYFSLYTFFIKRNVALNNIANYFYNSYKEEFTHAESFAKYLTTRGGTIKLSDVHIDYDNVINRLTSAESSILEAFTIALEKEREVTGYINNLVECANSNNDNELSDYLSQFLSEQTQAIYSLEVLCTQIKRLNGDSYAIHMYNESFNPTNPVPGLNSNIVI